MKVRYGKEVANHSGPESCGDSRKGVAEALTGVAEGNTGHGANRKSCDDPARSETLNMSGSLLHRSWEISSATVAADTAGAEKADRRKPAIHTDERSDTLKLPKKPPNKGSCPAEAVEGRGVAKGNADRTPTPRTLSRTSC